jgi:flagellar capping protein FliD
MKSIANTFADTTYRSDIYKQVGISVDGKTGELSVDEDKLAKALTENGSRVENALGKNGLAGKASHHAEFALAQQDKAFPSMKTMLGSELNLASAYTNPKVLTANVQYNMIGNLLNMAW